MFQARYSNGSDGLPVGYPIECRDESTLRAGFTQTTPAEVQALQAQFKTQYDAFIAARKAQEADAAKDGAVDGYFGGIDRVQFQMLFNHENRIRVLESRPQITLAQFKAAIKAML